MSGRNGRRPTREASSASVFCHDNHCLCYPSRTPTQPPCLPLSFPSAAGVPGVGRLSWVIWFPFLRRGSDPATLQVGWSLKSTSEKRDEKLTAMTPGGVQKRGVLEGSERYTPRCVRGPRKAGPARWCGEGPPCLQAPWGASEPSSTVCLRFVMIQGYQKYLKIFKL